MKGLFIEPRNVKNSTFALDFRSKTEIFELFLDRNRPKPLVLASNGANSET